MLVNPKKRNVGLFIFDAIKNTFRIASGFINGVKPSITKTSAIAVKRSEKLISNNQFHHYHFNEKRPVSRVTHWSYS